MRRVVLVALALAVLAASIGLLFQVTPSGDRTVTRIDLEEDGDAEMSFVVSIDLPNESERTAFERLQSDIEAPNSSDRTRFSDAMEALVDRANDSIDRRMRATDVEITTRIEPLPVRRGVVEYSFTWTGFAQRDGDALVVGDTIGGYVLGNDEALEITLPDGYDVTSAVPEADERRNGSVRWGGPQTFAEDRPRLRVEPSETDGGGTPAEPDGEGDDTVPGGPPLLPWAALVVLVAVAVGGLYLYRQRSQAADEPEMTDEERVVAMIDRAGGQLKQKRITEETEWSAAKVSQVTSGLEDDGEIEKLRMGRENILRFPEDDEP